MGVLKKGALHAFAPQNPICFFCGLPLTKGSSSSSSGIRVFNCGHAIHMNCESGQNEPHNTHSAVVCSVCQHSKNPRTRSKSAIIENGLVNNLIFSAQQSRGNPSFQHLHETDLVDKSHGLQQMSRVCKCHQAYSLIQLQLFITILLALLTYSCMTSSQFDILNNLQKNKSLHIDILPQLRLTPPAIYHEKVQKGPVSSTRELQDTTLKKEKKSIKRWQLKEPKSKGPLPSRFPLNSSLFGVHLLHLLHASIIIN